VYTNFGKGFETPTFAEIAYKGVNVSSLNFDLKPSVSKNFEIGLKTKVNDNLRINTAAFYILTNDEIVPLSNASGRATFQNAPQTRRQGLELAFDANLGDGYRAYGALTYLDARFTRGFSSTTTANGITTPAKVPGNYILPGAPASTAYGEVSWKQADTGFHAAVEGRVSTKVYVNDVNRDAASGNYVINLRGGYRIKSGNWDLDTYARVDNLLEEKYAGSVIVNEANSRFFEPAPRRNSLIGVNGKYSF
jgi:iron complex outermembrane receptor protein